MLISTASGRPISNQNAEEKGRFALALGCFDGVHLGHAALFRALRENAEGKKRAVWTFAPPEGGRPCPVKGKPLIASYEQKLSLLAEHGVEHAFLYDFSQVCSLDCEEFVDKILIGECGCGLAVCGYNFTFGRYAAGNAQTLTELLARRGVRTVVVDNISVGGFSVSSAAIRTALSEGDMEKAAMLLGRSYAVTAPVIGGRRLGRELGFPTINQHFFEGAAVPRRGVYAAVCSVDGKEYPAVTNVGVRPTVSGGSDVVTAETHIIGYSGDLYGRTVSVELRRFMRPERTFGGREELTAAVLADIKSAEKYYSENIAK